MGSDRILLAVNLMSHLIQDVGQVNGPIIGAILHGGSHWIKDFTRVNGAENNWKIQKEFP